MIVLVNRQINLVCWSDQINYNKFNGLIRRSNY